MNEIHFTNEDLKRLLSQVETLTDDMIEQAIVILQFELDRRKKKNAE